MNFPKRESLALKCEGENLRILDQTLLPQQEVWVDIKDTEHMIACIQRLAVRGAPLIGIAAALTLALEAIHDKTNLKDLAMKLRDARPTAVNLMHAIDRLLPKCRSSYELLREAISIHDEDVRICEALNERAEKYINSGDCVLTHCNTGALVCVGKGTALGAIKEAHDRGKKIHVYVDETRPLLQGSRLTAWELSREGIPFSVITDSMAAFAMEKLKINSVFVGADRIAANGDVANKVGTYALAIAAKYHDIPFYVVAPSTTFDPHTPTGAEIPIEARAPTEVVAGYRAWNPAFDITPRSLITKVILEDREV